MKADAIRVVIADDDPVVQYGLSRAITRTPVRVQVLGVAENGEEAVKMTQVLKPDVVIMDVMMPGMGGAKATRELLTKCPDVRIIALSGHMEPDLVRDMLKAGARAYLLKGLPLTEMTRTMEAVMEGRRYFSPDVLDLMAEDYSKAGRPGSSGPDPRLTERQNEVVELTKQGLPSKAIGERLNIKASTVDYHRFAARRALGVTKTAELAKKAGAAGASSSVP
jgi:DNA-binding NarL/FixJ family response regulator